jgi:NhaP-type Na+/H+ or K+/H+ antiporter
MPRVIGYVIVGFAIAPIADYIGMAPLLDHTRIFVDIALGLVLFDLGRRMDLAWMKRDWTLAAKVRPRRSSPSGSCWAR